MMEPVAWRVKSATGYTYHGHSRLAQMRSSDVGEPLEPLVRLSDAEARIAELEAALSSAKDDVDLWQHRSSVWKKRAEEEEARAEAAEALLKEAGKALEPFAQEADAWESYSDIEAIVEDFPSYFGKNIRVSDLRAARAIHHKIGVKDE